MRADQTGIYSIEHVASGKKYVGSAVQFAQRWRGHRCHLRKGTHHSAHLQAAWNKYGELAFEFKKLIVCAKSDLLFYEQRLIDGYRASDRMYGFNARPNAESNLGKKVSEATRIKIREARAKQVFTAEHKAAMSAARKGRKMPDWFGAFTRSHRSGTKHTVESRAKISAAQIGKPQTLQRIERRFKTSFARVEAVRAEYAGGAITQTALAAKHGIDQSTVSLMVRGKRWGRFTNQQENGK